MAKLKIDENALRNDIKKYLTTYALTYANEAAEKFTEAAKQTIIDVYYGQYSPEYYDRTEDLMNNSYYKYRHNNGRIMYGGVIISDRDMSDYVNTWYAYDLLNESNGDAHEITSITPASKVLQWSWGKGYHGYKNGNPADAIYTFPPIAALEQKIGELTKSLDQTAVDVARSQSYSFLRF